MLTNQEALDFVKEMLNAKEPNVMNHLAANRIIDHQLRDLVNRATRVKPEYWSDSVEAAGDGQYALDDKVDGFSGKLSADDEITIMKKVTGNQGDKSKKFTFTLEIKKAIPNFTYTLGASDKIKTGYTNDKSGVIPTGILINNKAAVTTVLAGGVVAFMVIKKKREEVAE